MDNCDLNPEFAVICSFIAQFGDKIDLQLNIEQLKSSIEDQSQLDNGLIELHIKLLKKIRRYFVRDQWEKALIRFASEYSYEDAVEIESLGYLKTRPSIKLNLLRRLLDAQFECDQKFKAAVNLCEANQLRLQPIGRDIKGNTYWHRKDDEGNFRIFLEQPLDYNYWKAICTKPEELNYLIEELDKSKEEKVKGEPITEPYDPLPEIFPEYFKKLEKKEKEEVDKDGKQGQEQIINDTQSGKRPVKTKKGGSRGGVKKSSPLPVLKEADEEGNIIYKSSKNDTIIERDGKENIIVDDMSKTISSNSSDQNSIESQVKTTIENLINRVASSFSNFIRPLTGSPVEPIAQEKPTEQAKKPRKRQSKKEKLVEENLPRRSSSRIQQLQQKKIAEQQEELKKIIETAESKKSNFVASQDDDSRSQSTSSRKHRKRNSSPDDDFSNNKKRRRKGQSSWRRGKGKKKLSWDKDDSDLSSTSSLTESEEDELDDAEDTFKYDNTNLDDEFACEEEDTNLEPVIIKRARTARQSVGFDEQRNLDSTIIEEDKPCERCDKSNDPEWILLCDMCDDGYHTSCCLPPLMIVPDGDWFCPPCEHKLLLTNLREFYTSITELLEAKERERMKKQRLRQNFVKKEPANEINQEVLPEKRQRGFLNELNDPIAVQNFDEDIEEGSDFSEEERAERHRPKKAAKTKKTARKLSNTEIQNDFCMSHRRPRKTYSRRSIQESGESDNEEEGSPSGQSYSSEELKPKARRARASVSYRFQEYDELIKSAIKGDSYDEESNEERESVSNNSNYGRGKDMATIEALAYQQENGITNPDSAVSAEGANIQQTKQKPRKKSRRLNDLDAVSETEDATSDESFQASSATEAEDDEDILTDVETEFDSDASTDELVSSQRPRSKKKRAKKSSYDSEDSEYQPTRTRRAASKRVSYAESTEGEDSSFLEAPRKSKKNVLSSDEESQASWKSSAHDSPIDEDPEDDEKSTSCDASPDQSGGQDDSSDEIVTPAATQEDIPQVQQPVHLQSNTSADLTEQQTTATTPQQGFKKVRLERKEQVIMVHNSTKPGLNDSIDEIAAPLYHQPLYHTIPLQPPLTYTSLDHGQPVLAPGQLCHPNEKSRDPIQDLIQYCSDSANSATMFNSYTETLSTKSFVSSPAHPPFYGDEDLRPSSSSENRKRA